MMVGSELLSIVATVLIMYTLLTVPFEPAEAHDVHQNAPYAQTAVPPNDDRYTTDVAE